MLESLKVCRTDMSRALVMVIVTLFSASASAAPMSLVIGIDGLGFGTQGFSVASSPNMDALINGTWQVGYKGAYSDNAFAGGELATATQQATVSGPGWSTIHTGVWVDQHNVSGNSFSSPDFTNNPSYLETLEESVANLHSASVINWSPIDTHIVSTVDDGNSSMDLRSTPGGDANVTTAAVSHIAGLNTANPAAIFIHYDELDGVGHSVGSSGAAYGTKITSTDTLVGQLLAAVTSRATFASEDWQIIVVSDHGHTPSGGHGGQSALERTIPLIVASKNLNQGDLSNAVQQVSHADVAPTVLEHFGLNTPNHYYGISRASGAPATTPPNPPSGNGAAPEPGSLVLLAIGTVAICMRRGRSRGLKE